MDNMVERVAKALQEAHGPALPSPYEAMARAALTAMRHPTDGMKGYAKHRLPGVSRDTAHDVWMLMIDEALSK